MNALTLVPQHSANVQQFSMGEIERIAEAIAKGGLFGSKDPYAVLTLCLLAQAEGQHPAVVFRDYHIIQGKPAKKSEAMLRDFIMSGGKVEWHQLDDDCADATFSHTGGGTARISWDKARVAKAELGGNAMHKKYPRQMLRSRVISEGVRTVFPGATSGLYVPEEVSAFDGARDTMITDQTPRREPAPRTVLDGPYKSKTAIEAGLKRFQTALFAAADLGALDAILEQAEPLIEQAKRDVPDFWAGVGDDDDGFEARIEAKRASFASGALTVLIASAQSCTTKAELDDWAREHGDTIEGLPDSEQRTFTAAYDEHASALQANAAMRDNPVTAG